MSENKTLSISELSAEIATDLSSVESITEKMQAQKRARPGGKAAFVAPRTPTEEKVAAIWTELLCLERIGIHDDFFELGGHSLLATQVLSRVNATFQVELSLEILFTIEEFTVAQIARAIEQYIIERADLEKIAAMCEELKGLSDEQVKALLADEELR